MPPKILHGGPLHENQDLKQTLGTQGPCGKPGGDPQGDPQGVEPWGVTRGNPQGDSGALRDPRLAGHAGLALAAWLLAGPQGQLAAGLLAG